jgi:hypothetical protein
MSKNTMAITPAEVRYTKTMAVIAYLEGDLEAIPKILGSLTRDDLWKLKDDAEQVAVFAENEFNEREEE